jgi:hypothetical protein
MFKIFFQNTIHKYNKLTQGHVEDIVYVKIKISKGQSEIFENKENVLLFINKRIMCSVWDEPPIF